MTGRRSVVVKVLPSVLDATTSQACFQELQPDLEAERPCLVFDLSEVRQMDSSGVDLLLRSVEEAMKRNGDVKLAGVRSEAAVILEMTRIDRLFEIFDTSNDAVESFYRFSAGSLQPRMTQRPGTPRNANHWRE